MPVKLTEDMVVARSKGSDLYNIKKLNCWGSELSDVSVIRKLTNVEVLSLSVNQITTLTDFQHCSNLQELYIRKNNIKDINELLYLRQLPKLKSLWLADNPCAQFQNYRLTVLRTLPHLQKLDNVAVEGEEVQQAMVTGLLLPLGQETSSAASQDKGSDGRSSDGGGTGGSLSDYSPPASTRAQRQQNGYSSPEREQQQHHSQQGRRPSALYDEDEDNEEDDHQQQRSNVSPARRASVAGTAAQHSPAPQSPTRRPSHANATVGEYETPAPASGGAEYAAAGGDSRSTGYISREQEALPPHSRRVSRESYRDGSWVEGVNVGAMMQQHYDTAYRRLDAQMEAASLRPPSEGRPYTSRPKTRNGNVLSAVLCLIKELDYTSLEVAEMAIRCRMDELDD